MRVLVVLIALFLTGCDLANRDTSYKLDERVWPKRAVVVEQTAIQYLGLHERQNRKEIKELVGVDPVYTEWCAAFVNAVLEESGVESNKDHRYPLTARAFLDWGQKVPRAEIQPGDIVIFPRGNQGWQGHVGFFIKSETIGGITYYMILGGNQSNKVSIKAYRASRALGIRRRVISF